MYYQENSSPIATDGVLFQFDEEGFRGGQGFRIPREDVYNVTIAGAAGGRGLCNIHFGHGCKYQFQIRLTPDYDLLVMVGQKGRSPCDNPSGHPLCDTPPTNEGTSALCNQTWYDTDNTTINSVRFVYSYTGGGGGASMLRARNVENRSPLDFPIAVTGGGGGTSAILDYAAMTELISSQTKEPTMMQLNQSYRYHIDARLFSFTDVIGGISSTRGYRPLSQVSLVGAGGGWTSLLSSSDTDGKPIGESLNFAQGGLDCGRSFPSLQIFEVISGDSVEEVVSVGEEGEVEATLEELCWILETTSQEEVVTQLHFCFHSWWCGLLLQYRRWLCRHCTS